jgi:histone acetyltransferase 1
LCHVLVNPVVSSLQHDDVEGKIREIIPAGFSCNTDDFTSLLEKEANFKPFGTLLHTYHVHNVEEGEDFTYQIHKVHILVLGPTI